MINEDGVDKIVVDLEELKGNQLNESFLAAFGNIVKLLLNRMFGQGKGSYGPYVTIRGKKSDINSFIRTLGNEKKYIDAIRKYGLDDPRVTSNKAKLKAAVKSFERTTGIKWPFK